MTSSVAKYAAKKLLASEMAKYQAKDVAGDDDPFFAYVENPRTGRKKKVKKQVPDYIPEHDAKILARVRSRAYRLDVCLFNFLGIRFGWSSVVGLIPVVGDAIDFLLALSVVRTCTRIRCGLTKADYSLMMLHLTLDFFVGLVPFVGDLIDAAYKANTKNLRVLERRLDAVYKPKPQQESDDRLPPGRKPRPATVYEDFTEADLAGLANASGPPGQHAVEQPAAAQPVQVQPAPRRGWRSWFGSANQQPVDVEKGPVQSHRRPHDEQPMHARPAPVHPAPAHLSTSSRPSTGPRPARAETRHGKHGGSGGSGRSGGSRRSRH